MVLLFKDFEKPFSHFLVGKDVHVITRYSSDELIELIEEEIKGSKNVAVLVPGDITLFTPIQWLIDSFLDHAVVIPGVGTINYASSLLKKTLTLGGSTKRFVALSTRALDRFGIETLKGVVDENDTVAIYMNTWPKEKLRGELQKVYGKDKKAAFFRNLCLEDEFFEVRELSHWPKDLGEGKLDLIVVGPFLEKKEDRDWWEERRIRDL